MINTEEAKNKGKQGRKAKIEQFAPPHFGNCWTHFDHFPKFISCVLYLVSKLGKSGVHSFKRYSIWIWNKEVMAIWKNPISHLGRWIVPCAKFSHDTSPCAKFAQRIPLCEIFAPPFPCANFWASSSLPSPIPSLWASFLCSLMPKTRGGYASAP